MTGPTVPEPVRVLLCDDSPTVRAALARVLEGEGCRVVGRVGDGRQALHALDSLPPAEQPAVVLLDLEMPVMDGMTALPLLLARPHPPAVIVASALTQRGAAAAMAALRAGAVDYVPKPGASGGGVTDPMFRNELVAKVRGWARLSAASRQPGGRAAAPAPAGVGVVRQPVAAPLRSIAGVGSDAVPRLIGIGCSTGGPQALATLVPRLTRPLAAPVLIVQHMPAGFTAMLADHLGRLGGPPCAEAKDGEALRPGHLYVAPGDRHLLAEPAAGGFVARLTSAAPEHFCRPAADPMLRSLAAGAGARVLAVILTGMGQDGLEGCRAVTAAGGTVLVQDAASSVVWGMPGAVARAGLAAAQLTPERIAEELVERAAVDRRTQHGQGFTRAVARLGAA